MYWEMDVVCDEMCSSSRLRMNGHSTFGYWSLYHKGQIKNIWNGNSDKKEKVGKRMKSVEDIAWGWQVRKFSILMYRYIDVIVKI